MTALDPGPDMAAFATSPSAPQTADRPAGPQDDVAALRRFNRFSTALAGALNEGLLASPFSLAEARVMYELRHRASPTAARLAEALALDPAYLSRILARLRKLGVAEARPGAQDRRARLLGLTEKGEAEMDALESASRAEAEARLAALPPDARLRLRRAMSEVEALLSPAPASLPPVILRAPRVGDMAWVAHRHGALYAAEYNWNAGFEALVSRICADFIERQDPATHRGWIAERDGSILGAVFLVPGEAPGAAKLRMLYLEPAARGLGLGRRLVRECIRAARDLGYARLDLWTHDVLAAARAIYASEGFSLVDSSPAEGFGAATVEETWSLDLTA